MKRPGLSACLWLVVAACATAGKPAAPQPAESASKLQLRGRVERGILPAVQVVGEDVGFTLAERMAKHRVPGLGIAVFEDYELVWAGAYGVVDVDSEQPVRDTTLFQAGSISKSVNALAVLMLAAEGKLDLDAPINDALRSWKLPDNPLTLATPVTLRRLLSHTAGTTVHGFPGYPTGAPVPTLVQVLDGLPPANTPAVRVDLAPGTKFRYSGGGTTITQLALVDTLGAAYPDILAARVLGPLGMTSSTYEQALAPELRARAASGHLSDGTVVATKRHVYPEMAAAGLWTTPTDLGKFFLELALARGGRSKRVSKAIAEAMTTVVDAEGHVGLGVFVTQRNGAALFGHGGADEGFQANASASLDRGFGVFVMANSDNGFRLFGEVERTVFAAMGWPGADVPVVRVALTPAQRAGMVGDFEIAEGPPFAIAADGDGLVMLRPFVAPQPLVAVSATALVRVEDGIRFTFLGADEIQLSAADEPLPKARRRPAAKRAPLVELAAGRFDEAVAAWQALLRADPASARAGEDMHNSVAYRLLRDGQTADAIAVFRMIAAVFPGSSNAYDSLGEAHARVGDKPAAIAAYETALARLDADPSVPADEKPQRRAQAVQRLKALRGR